MMNPSVEVMDIQTRSQKEKLTPVKASSKHYMESEDDKIPGSYDCNICGRSFPFMSSLSQHMRRHTGARPYKCPYCDHRASQKGNLKVHIRSHKLGTLSSHHSNDEQEGGAEEEEMSVSEGLDGGTSPTKSSSACNRMMSGDGAEDSRRKVPVRSMKREKPLNDQRPYCCRLCGYEAQREDQLLSHIEKVHITVDIDEQTSVKEEAVAEPDVLQPQCDGTFPCETCGQVFTQAWFLKSHMKKHAGILDHCCRICGRRFREAWFLKSHMKTHNTRSRSRAKSDSAEHPATINDVAQDPEIVSSVASVYQMCSKCGNLFDSRESLRAHDKVHKEMQSPQMYANKSASRSRPSDEDSPVVKKRLLDYLGLQPFGEKAVEDDNNRILGQRIPELNPVCSYQAWNLATKGKVVEPVECNKASSDGASIGDEDLATAAVVCEKESSSYVLQEKRSSVRRSSSGLANHVSSGDQTPESLSDSEYRPSSRQERRRPSQSQAPSKSHECFECGKMFRNRHQVIVHQRVHRKEEGRISLGDKERTENKDQWGSTSDPESGSPRRPFTPGYGDSPPASTLRDHASEMGTANSGELADEKPYICSLCDFVTTESQTYLAHVRVQHPASSADKTSPIPRVIPDGYSKLKKALLQGMTKAEAPPAHPSTCSSPLDPVLTPVDLCVRVGGHRGRAPATQDRKILPNHKCSFCSHSTLYPEVLWMHQTIAHRMTSSSSNLAPKWALKNNNKGPRDSLLSSRRRTGPPPVLEGKECPPLPTLTRAQRTRPPIQTSEVRKKNKTGGNAGTTPPSSSTPSPLSSRASTATARPHAGRVHQNQPPRFRHKVTCSFRGSSQASSSSAEKSPNNISRSPAPCSNSSTASRRADHYMMPQEGLGFMLSSKYSGQAENNRAGGFSHQPLTNNPIEHRTNAMRPSTIIHSSTMGQGYGASQAHGSMLQTYSGSSSFSSKPKRNMKQETPKTSNNILGFLKNYSPHDLAALYHRWGATNALLDPTGMLRSLMQPGQHFCHECGKSFSQPSHLRTHMRSHTVGFDLNGLHRGTDAHTTASEVPKQGRGLSAASSAHTEPLRKAT